MKRDGISKVLSLCVIGLLFFADNSFVGNEMEVVLSTTTALTSLDKTIAPKAVDTVVIKGMVFEPKELHVHKGDIVVWINKDIVAHNVTDSPENKWTSGNLNRGISWKKTIGETFDYYCSIHPTMTGKIIVDP